jgi:hypothetical protein
VCDPRTLAPGEVRARQIPCSDELVTGGEGRSGDWLLENAHARYVVRGTYAALTHLDEDGGTLIDAATPGGIDVLLEYLPDGDRRTIEAVQVDGEARLVLPGVTYRLGADDDVLTIEAAGSGVLQGRVGADRTGATVLGTEGSFVGFDGTPTGDGSAVALSGVTRAAVSREGLWPDGDDVDVVVDADRVLALDDGVERARLVVEDGRATGRVPAGALLVGERDGCAYDGVTTLGCAYLDVRVQDADGNDLVAAVTDRATPWPLPRGGGRVPLGPSARPVWVWAGPTYTAVQLAWGGVDAAATVTLHRAWRPDDVALAAPAVFVAPHAAATAAPEAAAADLAAEGVEFAVLLADDEIPTVSVDAHDRITAVAGSRAAASVWSWPWSPNSREPAHGAAPWRGLDALDLLAAMEGGQSIARLTVVDPVWVDRARTLADPDDWDPRPDAIWIDDLDDLPTFLDLLADRVDVTPLGPRTWIGVDADRNIPAYEAGIVDGRTTAGTGPRLVLTDAGVARGVRTLEVRLDAPSWMGMESVDLLTDASATTHDVAGAGRWRWTVPATASWIVAVARGTNAVPWSPDPAWAVSAPLWIVPPDRTPGG